MIEDEVFWGSRWLGSLPLFDERGPRKGDPPLIQSARHNNFT
jgi:hypothetical protein